MKNLVGDKGKRKGEIMGEMEENCEVSYRSVLSPAEFWVDVTREASCNWTEWVW